MKLPQLWQRMLLQPAPRHPVRQFFGTIAGAFALGLMASLFVPPSWATDSVPIRIDLPFRAGAIGSAVAFTSIGMLLLGPGGRKTFVITAVLLLPVLAGAGVALLAPIFREPLAGFETLSRRLPTLQWIIFGSGAIVLIIPACGWLRWLQEIGRKENAAWQRRLKQTGDAEGSGPQDRN